MIDLLIKLIRKRLLCIVYFTNFINLLSRFNCHRESSVVRVAIVVAWFFLTKSHYLIAFYPSVSGNQLQK